MSRFTVAIAVGILLQFCSRSREDRPANKGDGRTRSANGHTTAFLQPSIGGGLQPCQNLKARSGAFSVAACWTSAPAYAAELPGLPPLDHIDPDSFGLGILAGVFGTLSTLVAVALMFFRNLRGGDLDGSKLAATGGLVMPSFFFQRAEDIFSNVKEDAARSTERFRETGRFEEIYGGIERSQEAALLRSVDALEERFPKSGIRQVVFGVIRFFALSSTRVAATLYDFALRVQSAAGNAGARSGPVDILNELWMLDEARCTVSSRRPGKGGRRPWVDKDADILVDQQVAAEMAEVQALVPAPLAAPANSVGSFSQPVGQEQSCSLGQVHSQGFASFGPTAVQPETSFGGATAPGVVGAPAGCTGAAISVGHAAGVGFVDAVGTVGGCNGAMVYVDPPAAICAVAPGVGAGCGNPNVGGVGTLQHAGPAAPIGQTVVAGADPSVVAMVASGGCGTYPQQGVPPNLASNGQVPMANASLQLGVNQMGVGQFPAVAGQVAAGYAPDIMAGCGGCSGFGTAAFDAQMQGAGVNMGVGINVGCGMYQQGGWFPQATPSAPQVTGGCVVAPCGAGNFAGIAGVGSGMGAPPVGVGGMFQDAAGMPIAGPVLGHAHAPMPLQLAGQMPGHMPAPMPQQMPGIAGGAAGVRPSSSPNGQNLMPGDWWCPGCGDHVFARNPACRRCATPRPDSAGFNGGCVSFPGAVGGFPPPRPRPQTVMPGDWNCPRCGDLQFARNKTCRMCGGDRPETAGVPDPPPLGGKGGGGPRFRSRSRGRA